MLLKTFSAFLDVLCPPRPEVAVVRALQITQVKNLLDPVHTHGVTALARYRDPHIRALIHAHKFYRHDRALELLAFLGAQWLRTKPTIDILVPIPLSATRERTRGFNQVTVILEAAVRELERPPSILPLLIRTNNTAQQSHLSRTERHRNVRGAFAWNSAYNPAHYTGKHVVLIDDVVTTGTTLHEAAKVLKYHLPKDCTLTLLALAH